MSILEELWYGNVNPGELNMKKHSPCKELRKRQINHVCCESRKNDKLNSK